MNFIYIYSLQLRAASLHPNQRMVSQSPTPSQTGRISIPDIWIDALSRYTEETGFDLGKERAGNYRDLHDCSSPEDALRLIAGLVDVLYIAQEKRIRLAFSNVFRFVLVVNDAVAELAASLVRRDLLPMIPPPSDRDV